jgi:hypothetical protein
MWIKSVKMARIDPQVNIRVPQELKDKIEEAAKENGRSINSETVLRLEQSFVEQPDIKPSFNDPEFRAKLERAMDIFSRIEYSNVVEEDSNHKTVNITITKKRTVEPLNKKPAE